MKHKKIYLDFIDIVKKIKFTFSQLYESSFGNNYDIITQPKYYYVYNNSNYINKITTDDDWGWFVYID